MGRKVKFSFFKRKPSEKKLQEVLEKYQKDAEQNPRDIRIHVKIAELYLEHHKKDEAIEEYLLAARAYQDKRLLQIAVAIYNHIISVFPDHVDIYTELSDIHIKNGFIGDGVAILEKLANYYYENSMKFEATNVLKKISKIDPDNKFFRIKVAKFYANKDLSEEQTLKEGPKDKWKLVEKNKDREPVKETPSEGFFDLAAALEDDVSISITTVTNEENTETDEPSLDGMAPEKVFKELKTIMESEPEQDSPQFHFNLGMAYQRCKQFEEAVDEYQKALEGPDNKAECCISLAECNMMLNRFEEAQNFIKKGLNLDSLTEEQRLDLSYQAGLAYKAQGDTKKALKVFKKIYDSDKSFKSVVLEIKELSKQ